MPDIKEDRSLGELFAELADDTSTLVRQEVALATTELTQKATRAAKQIGFLVVGGLIAYAAFLAILAAIIIGLAQIIPAWLAALFVGLIVAAVAAWLITKALHALKETDLTPRQTVETLKEDVQWMKDQV